MNSISRRSVLSGVVSLAASRGWSQSLPANPDVIVIGAGAAGLSAAHRLMAAGKSVLVVEAADRVGGRGFSESTTFGQPFDHGCSWITAGNNNPFKGIATRQGFDLLDHTDADDDLFVHGRRADAAQRGAFNRGWGAVERALDNSGRAGLDVAASSVIPADIDFSGVAQTWIGPMDWGVDFTKLSTMDYWMAEDAGPSFMVREGLGAVIATLADGVPVSLGTPATRIDWAGPGVSVDTPRGRIRSRACVVTVSTGVLNAGAIRFFPELPVRKQQAIADVPMGLLAKITLQFDGNRLGFVPNHWLTYWVPNDMPAEACYFLTWPFDYSYMVGFVGGEFGWQLSRAGTGAAVDFALGEIVKIAGSSARRHFVKGHLTDWAENPLTLGAYAAARPGRYQARARLAEPVGGRLFFAGEAVGGAYVALCSGAYLSGQRAADEVLNSGI